MRKWLIEIRESIKLTQEELASKVGITRQMIGMIENGTRPSVDTAKKIAGVLGFEWVRIFEDSDKEAI